MSDFFQENKSKLIGLAIILGGAFLFLQMLPTLVGIAIDPSALIGMFIVILIAYRVYKSKN